MSQEQRSATEMPEKHCASCRCFAPRRKVGGGIKRTAADRRISTEIRERDGWTCQWPGCGHVFTPPNTGGLEAAHCFSRRIAVVRLDRDNLISLCTAHHFHADSHPLEKYALFQDRLGPERFDALEAKAKGKRDR